MKRQLSPSLRPRAAYTLIEIMLVVCLLGIVMTMGLPAIYRISNKEDLRKAVADIVEVCSNARAQAILRGTTVILRIRPQEGRFDISTAPPPARASGEGGDATPPAPSAAPRSGLSCQVSDRLLFEMVDVNFIEHKEDEEAKVRFFSDGTCDEMTVILRSIKGEYRKISLEITTGLASVDNIGTR
jgi:type II secretory pathway pseudopilin PulG